MLSIAGAGRQSLGDKAVPAPSFAKEGSTAVLKPAVGTGLSDTKGKGVFGILAQAAVAAAGKEKKREKKPKTAGVGEKEKEERMRSTLRVLPAETRLTAYRRFNIYEEACDIFFALLRFIFC